MKAFVLLGLYFRAKLSYKSWKKTKNWTSHIPVIIIYLYRVLAYKHYQVLFECHWNELKLLPRPHCILFSEKEAAFDYLIPAKQPRTTKFSVQWTVPKMISHHVLAIGFIIFYFALY